MCTKRWAIDAAVIATLTVLATTTPKLYAGEYHWGTTGKCADCHTMHASQQHDYSGAGSPITYTPTAYLLKATTVAALCNSCHDGQTYAPDVFAANTNSYVRAGGALNDSTTGAAGYQIWMGHTLGSTAQAPGGTWSNANGLTCTDCHDPHGISAGTDVKGNTVATGACYRNLKPQPGTAAGNIPVSYAKGTNDLTKDVYLRSWTLGALSTNYAVTNVDFNKPLSTDSGTARWCVGCHTNAHANAGTVGIAPAQTQWLRHPTENSKIGAVGDITHSTLSTWTSKTNHVKTMDANGIWGPTSTDLTPTCVSCHKAHGNKNPFGLIYMSGTGTVTEEGDSGTQLSDLCRQCHVQV